MEIRETRQKRTADSPARLIAEMLCAIAVDKRAKDAGRRGCAMRKLLPMNRGAHLTLAMRDLLLLKFELRI
jgi:hypothetical protein